MNIWPADPAERNKLMTRIIEATKQFLKEHPGSEWGAFLGENKGYGIGADTPQDIMELNIMLSPYVTFKT